MRAPTFSGEYVSAVFRGREIRFDVILRDGTAEGTIPMDRPLQTLVRDTPALRRTLRRLSDEVSARRGGSPGWFFCVPDSFGLWEREVMISAAVAEGMQVNRFVIWSAAAAFWLMEENSAPENAWIAVEDESGTALSVFDQSDRVCEPYIIGVGRPVVFRKEEERSWFEDSDAPIFLLSTAEERAALERQFPGRTCLSCDPARIRDGLVAYIRAIKGFSKPGLLLQELSPYPVTLSVDGETLSWEPIPTIPTKMSWEPEAGIPMPKTPILLLEQRDGQARRCGRFEIGADEVTEAITALTMVVDLLSVDELLVRSGGEERRWRFVSDPEPIASERSVEAPAGSPSLEEFLAVADSLEYGVRMITDPTDGNAQGLIRIHQQMLDILRRYGITPTPGVGEPFRVEYHEAVGHEIDPAYPPQTVCRVIRAGYLQDGTLIRPGRVIVAN